MTCGSVFLVAWDSPLQTNVASWRAQVVQTHVVHLGVLRTHGRVTMPYAIVKAMILLVRREWV